MQSHWNKATIPNVYNCGNKKIRNGYLFQLSLKIHWVLYIYAFCFPHKIRLKNSPTWQYLRKQTTTNNLKLLPNFSLHTEVPLPFWHKLNYFSFCRNFEKKIFIIWAEILIKLKFQLSGLNCTPLGTRI